MSFGNKLKQLRLENNMTQEELSNILNVSRATVGRYENDERFPDKNILEKIADFFEVSIDFLFERVYKKNGHFQTNIKEDSNKYEFYKEIMNEINIKLIEENIIKKGDLIPKNILQLTVNYGLNAAVEIYKAKNNFN